MSRCAEIGDLALRFLVLLLGGIERLFERRELAAQRRDLLVEHLDLCQRACGKSLLGIDLAGELGDLALRIGCAAAEAFVEPLEAVAFAFGPGEARAHLGELLLEAELAGLLQRQQLGELRNLRGETRERGVLAGDLLRQIELHDHEHGEQEDDAEDQRRQRVDEAGPIVHAGVAAGACKSHVVLT